MKILLIPHPSCPIIIMMASLNDYLSKYLCGHIFVCFLLYLRLIIDVHIKRNLSTGIHGSSAAVTASSIGILFSYMVHSTILPHSSPFTTSSSTLVLFRLTHNRVLGFLGLPSTMHQVFSDYL
jgi:hypothetical protein